jgi:hypothetical protein
MKVVPITLAEANEYVVALHRHNGRLPGAKFAVGAVDGDGLVCGVAIAGIPKARLLADGGTLEVSRVCTDGSRNVCSMLYGACLRAAKAMGFYRAITYTLEVEAGASLRASGWTRVSESSGGGWKRPNQPNRRGQKDEHDLGVKWRWEVRWADPCKVLWPAGMQDDGQDALDLGAVS